jgi:hypothetical protein
MGTSFTPRMTAAGERSSVTSAPAFMYCSSVKMLEGEREEELVSGKISGTAT